VAVKSRFIYPTSGINNVLVNQYLLVLVLDYPQETIKTALDIIISGTMRLFPDCKGDSVTYWRQSALRHQLSCKPRPNPR
jgi:hypothetical protein